MHKMDQGKTFPSGEKSYCLDVKVFKYVTNKKKVNKLIGMVV